MSFRAFDIKEKKYREIYTETMFLLLTSNILRRKPNKLVRRSQ